MKNGNVTYVVSNHSNPYKLWEIPNEMEGKVSAICLGEYFGVRFEPERKKAEPTCSPQFYLWRNSEHVHDSNGIMDEFTLAHSPAKIKDCKISEPIVIFGAERNFTPHEETPWNHFEITSENLHRLSNSKRHDNFSFNINEGNYEIKKYFFGS